MIVKKSLLKIYILAVLIVSLTMVGVVKSSPEPVVVVDPSINWGIPGATFTINITVADVAENESLYSWEFGISFNSSIINATSIMEGPFLKTAGGTFFSPYINNEEFPDNKTGVVGASDLLTGLPPTGAYGNGILANITFKVIAEGNTPLHFYGSELRHWNGTWPPVPMDHTSVDGVFTILGDTDGNGLVDASDLFDLSRAYDSDPSKSNWNRNCDFNRDKKIDDSDLSDLSENYGKEV